jgi:hypothetical protein
MVPAYFASFEPERNRAQAASDLLLARSGSDAVRTALLETLVDLDGQLLVYDPELDHYSVVLGDLDGADHVALMVPGVGDLSTLSRDWLPSAHNLVEAAQSTAVILWKGYDNPRDILAAATESFECDAHLMGAGRHLAEFVARVPLRPGQSLTVVAHSFGSVVTGTALADWDLQCTDVVVAGSPGMTVDEVRQLHVESGHFFAEDAPGDAVAGLGIFGSSPASPTFGGTRMRTNSDGHVAVASHSSYFVPGSQSLENIVAVVTGSYSAVVVHHTSLAERAGGIVTWTIKAPTLPLNLARSYRGPGFRVAMNARRFVDFVAAQTGNLVRNGLDECGRRVGHVRRHLGD